MQKFFFFCLLTGVAISSRAQETKGDINMKEVERIEKELSSDDMGGRSTGTPGIEKAAVFISNEMKKAGLLPMPGKKDFFQEFEILKPRQIAAWGQLNGNSISGEKILAFTTKSLVNITEKSRYKIVHISAADTFRKQLGEIWKTSENAIVFLDPHHAAALRQLKNADTLNLSSTISRVFVLTEAFDTTQFHFKLQHEFRKAKTVNIVGYLPGKIKKKEYVIFSSHYDHLGIGKPGKDMDSVYNGANDDASGVTAVLQLASWYKARANNGRSLLFVAFTAEEIGGFGSQYFSRQIKPAAVAAMFNIEMIGTESKWGNNSAYITGYEKSDFGAILQKNLTGTAFKYYPDPYNTHNLFYRSDNAALAKLGVPAHSISTSKMDKEANYHKPSDEIETLDLFNMTEIIRSIAKSARSIVAGKDRPSRIVE